jgi:hypothetical protein
MGVIEQLAEIRYQEGREEARQEFVRLLLTNTDFSPAKIAELVGVPISFVKRVQKELLAK